jgi:hypothetical protein
MFFRLSIADFDKSLLWGPRNSSVFCGRGVAKVLSGQKEGGCLDLNEAKKLGNKEMTD